MVGGSDGNLAHYDDGHWATAPSGGCLVRVAASEISHLRLELLG